MAPIGGTDAMHHTATNQERSLRERIRVLKESSALHEILRTVLREREGEASGQRGLDIGTGGVSLFGFARVPSIREVASGVRGGGRRQVEARHEAVAALREDMLALGTVVQALPDGLQVRLDKVAEWNARAGRAEAARGISSGLDLLDVRGTVPMLELRDAIQLGECERAIKSVALGQALLMVITKVDAHADLVSLSMRQSRINPQLSKSLILGKCHDPGYIRRIWGGAPRGIPAHTDSSSGTPGAVGAGRVGDDAAAGGGADDVNALLRADPLFWNPYAVEHMCQSLSIDAAARLGPSLIQPPPRELQRAAAEGCPSGAREDTGTYLALRQRQNVWWAEESVRKGVAHAADRNYMMALKCYQSALQLDERNADAWVAMGAAQANTSKFQEALSSFARALEIRPHHANARRYLEATRAKVRDTLGPLADAMLGNAAASPPRDSVPLRRSGGAAGLVASSEQDTARGGATETAERGRAWAVAVLKRQEQREEAEREREKRRGEKRERKKKNSKGQKKRKKDKKERKRKSSKGDRKGGDRKKKRRRRSPSRSSSSSSSSSSRSASSSRSPRPRSPARTADRAYDHSAGGAVAQNARDGTSERPGAREGARDGSLATESATEGGNSHQGESHIESQESAPKDLMPSDTLSDGASATNAGARSLHLPRAAALEAAGDGASAAATARHSGEGGERSAE